MFSTKLSLAYGPCELASRRAANTQAQVVVRKKTGFIVFIQEVTRLNWAFCQASSPWGSSYLFRKWTQIPGYVLTHLLWWRTLRCACLLSHKLRLHWSRRSLTVYYFWMFTYPLVDEEYDVFPLGVNLGPPRVERPSWAQHLAQNRLELSLLVVENLNADFVLQHVESDECKIVPLNPEYR